MSALVLVVLVAWWLGGLEQGNLLVFGCKELLLVWLISMWWFLKDIFEGF